MKPGRSHPSSKQQAHIVMKQGEDTLHLTSRVNFITSDAQMKLSGFSLNFISIIFFIIL